MNNIEMPSNKELCKQFNLTKKELKLTRLNKGNHIKIIKGSKKNIEKYPTLELDLGKWNTVEVLDKNSKPVYLGLPLIKKGEV